MLRQRHFLLLVALLATTWSMLTWAASNDEAVALVKRTANEILSTLQSRKAEIERNPSIIYGLVQKQVVPHFDFLRITQGAVGKYWRQATPAQQKALMDNFEQVLIRTYARSLLSYSGQEIRYLPVKPGPRENMVTVPTEVRDSGSSPIPVDYRMYQAGGQWKVFDVVIDNASLVGNYRSSFATEISQNGIDGLIAKLREMNAKGQE